MEERQRKILDILSNEARATVCNLAERLGVSDDTIRRDLNSLSDNGFLQKVHGGAVAIAIPQIARTTRAQILSETKSILGKAVAERIRAGQKILLDSGNTTLEVACSLPDFPLTIITNSLDIANCVSVRSQIRLVVTGGEWDLEQRLFKGSSVLQTINLYRADLVVLGACAINSKFAVTATDEKDAEIKRAMLEAATTKYIVFDHSKFDQQELYFVANLQDFDEVFTDSPIDISGVRPIMNVIMESNGSDN